MSTTGFWLLFWLTSIPVIAQTGRGLFDADSVLEISFSGNVGELMRDRGDDPQNHTFMLSFMEGDQRMDLQVQVKTRGHFRKMKENCTYPPLLITFPKGTADNTIFREQRKLKLVTPCVNEKFVIKEYLVYQLYSLTTAKSFRARLVRFSFTNTATKGKGIDPMYGILLEEEDQMARHNGMVAIDRQMLTPQQTEKKDFLNMAVFEYLIGNTDWSIQYLQNVKLIAKDSLAVPSPVPYDFDHAGIVGAPYAQPAPELQLSSTRERRYRGYCITEMSEFDEVLARYNQLKDKFYEVYSSNTLLDAGYQKLTLRYLDDFYKVINDPNKLKAEFQYPCRSNGTGNVVIKGLKKN